MSQADQAVAVHPDDEGHAGLTDPLEEWERKERGGCQATEECPDHLVALATRVRMEKSDLLGPEESLALLAKLDFLDLLDPLAKLVSKDPLVQMATTAFLENLVLAVPTADQETGAQWDSPALRDLKDPRDPTERGDPLAQMVPPVPQDPEVLPETWEDLAMQDLQDSLDLKVRLADKDLKDLQELMDSRVLQVHQVLRERLEEMESQEALVRLVPLDLTDIRESVASLEGGERWDQLEKPVCPALKGPPAQMDPGEPQVRLAPRVKMDPQDLWAHQVNAVPLVPVEKEE